MTALESGVGQVLSDAWRSGAELLHGAAVERMVLFANHLLLSEPVAQARLQPHAGSEISIEWTGVPDRMPVPPALTLVVTPAGLLELGDGTSAEPARRRLGLLVDVGQAGAAVLAGRRPNEAVRLEGDSGLATEAAWLLENLRWDVEADLARILPGGVAHEVARTGHRALQWLDGVRQRLSRGGS